MAECACLKSSTSLARLPTRELELDTSQTYQQQEQYSLPYYDSSLNDQAMVNMYPNCDDSDQNHLDYGGGHIDDNCYPQMSDYSQSQQEVQANSGTLVTMDQSINHLSNTNSIQGDTECPLSNPYAPILTTNDPMLAVTEAAPTDQDQYAEPIYQQSVDTSQQIPVSNEHQMVVYEQNETTTQPEGNGYEDDQVQQDSSIVTSSSSTAISQLSHQENPRINYDRQGRVVNVQYSNETVSLMRADDKEQNRAHIEALKHKLRYYQRKLAVKNHRYQKLKSQTKTRSKKTRLLESLKTCKADFSPCIFEIFKRQIKGPSSKHGNRWSDEVKSFASSIYIRSTCAYRFIRKSIDLPSESIVKRYIADKNLSKLPPEDLDDEDEKVE